MPRHRPKPEVAAIPAPGTDGSAVDESCLHKELSDAKPDPPLRTVWPRGKLRNPSKLPPSPPDQEIDAAIRAVADAARHLRDGSKSGVQMALRNWSMRDANPALVRLIAALPAGHATRKLAVEMCGAVGHLLGWASGSILRPPDSAVFDDRLDKLRQALYAGALRRPVPVEPPIGDVEVRVLDALIQRLNGGERYVNLEWLANYSGTTRPTLTNIILPSLQNRGYAYRHKERGGAAVTPEGCAFRGAPYR